MPDIQHPDLQENVYKLWIGGRTGSRMIYLIHKKKNLIFGMYVFPMLRNKIDYDRIPWLENAIEIHDDFMKGNISKFCLIDPVGGGIDSSF